jgi:Cu/Ag efflux pump CusA
VEGFEVDGDSVRTFASALRSVVFATLIVALVFLPLFLLSSVEGLQKELQERR